MGATKKERSIKILKKYLAASITERFLEEYWDVLNKRRPDFIQLDKAYNWINKKACSTVKPKKIEKLISCLELADEALSNCDDPPNALTELSEKTGRYLQILHHELTRNTSKKLKAGPIEYEYSETSC